LASGPDLGWPRVRGLLGLPRLPRIPSVVEPPLVSVGLPRGRQAGVAPAIHTGVRGWAQQGLKPGDIYAFMRSGVAPQNIER
jgi:hypothetical protein